MAAVIPLRRVSREPDKWAPAVAWSDRRYPSGWWIVPAILLGACGWLGLFLAVLS